MAQSSVFTDEASFLAQLDEPFLSEDFSGNTFAGTESSWSGNGFSADASVIDSPSSGDGLATTLFNDVGILSVQSSTDALVIDFSSNTTAFGGVFLASDLFFAPIPGLQLVFELSDGTNETVTTVSGTEFIGFVNLAGISSVTIDAPNGVDLFGDPIFSFPAATQLYVGAAIPTPGAAALRGVVGLAGIRRRR